MALAKMSISSTTADQLGIFPTICNLLKDGAMAEALDYIYACAVSCAHRRRAIALCA
jgi:hypothetical protein